MRRSSADRGNVRPNSHGVARFRFADVPAAGDENLGNAIGSSRFREGEFGIQKCQPRFLDRIPLLQDVQASWLLLVHCAAARVNYMTRVVEPGATQEFSTRNDAALWNCLCQIMQIPTQLDDHAHEARWIGISEAAGWASWADCLPMIQQRHPRIVALFVAQLSGQPHTTFFRAASEAPIHLARAGFVAPTWDALALDARPPPREPENVEPGGVRRGWQHSAASKVEKCARDEWFMRATDQVRALVRSQGGPGAGAALTHRAGNHDPVAPVSGHPPPQTPPTTPLHGPCLPMWPSLRRFWPPSRSMCPYWGAWTPRFRIGECRCKNLQRGRGPSVHQHIRPGLGHSHSNVGGQPPIGGRG